MFVSLLFLFHGQLRYRQKHWVVCSAPHALSPDALSPDTLSPCALSLRALSTDGLIESGVLYSIKL